MTFSIVTTVGLRPGEILYTLATQFVLLALFTTTFLIDIDPVWSLLFALLYYFHSIAVFALDIERIFSEKAKYGYYHLSSIILLFFIIVFQYAVLYCVAWNFDNGAFGGIQTLVHSFEDLVTRKLTAYGLFIYLSVVTTTGLGAGSVFPVSGWAFFFNMLNAVHFWFFGVFSVTRGVTLVHNIQFGDRKKNSHRNYRM